MTSEKWQKGWRQYHSCLNTIETNPLRDHRVCFQLKQKNVCAQESSSMVTVEPISKPIECNVTFSHAHAFEPSACCCLVFTGFFDCAARALGVYGQVLSDVVNIWMGDPLRILHAVCLKRPSHGKLKFGKLKLVCVNGTKTVGKHVGKLMMKWYMK